jgi:hypothetical protein
VVRSPLKVLAKDVHATLRAALSGPLAVMGFVPLKGSSFAVTRISHCSHLTISAQCDRDGWDALWGSRFTLEFQQSRQRDPYTASLLDRDRLAHLLNHNELEQLRVTNNSVIESLPGHLAVAALSFTDSDGFEATVVGYRPTLVSYTLGTDAWMHYFSAAHVETWCTWLSQSLPSCIEHFVQRRAEAI